MDIFFPSTVVTVHPELVEGCVARRMCFDKLSTNGCGFVMQCPIMD